MSVGLVIMRPTSIVVAGTGSSASIRADGGVDFTSATSLSLNGVFTADYDNYMINIRHSATDSAACFTRLRASGTDATAANYTRQYLYAAGSVIAAARGTSQTAFFTGVSSPTQRSGTQQFLYGPNLAQATAMRDVNVSGIDSAVFEDHACTHSLSTAYDGITFFPASGTITGMITVYGYTQ